MERKLFNCQSPETVVLRRVKLVNSCAALIPVGNGSSTGSTTLRRTTCIKSGGKNNGTSTAPSRFPRTQTIAPRSSVKPSPVVRGQEPAVPCVAQRNLRPNFRSKETGTQLG